MAEPAPQRRPPLTFERILALIFALLATLAVGLITLHWFLVLEPTLRTDALSRSRVLAQAQASAIEQRLESDRTNLLRTELETTLGGLLLLKDKATGQPFVQRIALRMDYDQFKGLRGSLDLARGADQCAACFVSEIPLYHPRNRQLIGIATFYLSSKATENLVTDFRSELLWGAGAMLCVIALAWAGTGRLLCRLGESEANLRGLFEITPFPMVLRKLGDPRISHANRAAKDYLALQPDRDGRYSSLIWRTLEAPGLPLHPGEQNERLIQGADGQEQWALVSAIPINIPAGPSQLVSLVDVSALKRIQRELLQASLTDSLTGLHNRRHLFLKLTEEAERAACFDYRFSIILFDIDHFKVVNDTFGHHVGDEVLVRVAAAIRGAVRDLDIAGRYGGEEFIVILPYADSAEALAVAERVCADVKTLAWPERGLSVTLSGGGCEYSGTSIDDLVEAADRKLYEAKRAGRDRVMW